MSTTLAEKQRSEVLEMLNTCCMSGDAILRPIAHHLRRIYGEEDAASMLQNSITCDPLVVLPDRSVSAEELIVRIKRAVWQAVACGAAMDETEAMEEENAFRKFHTDMWKLKLGDLKYRPNISFTFQVFLFMQSSDHGTFLRGLLGILRGGVNYLWHETSSEKFEPLPGFVSQEKLRDSFTLAQLEAILLPPAHDKAQPFYTEANLAIVEGFKRLYMVGSCGQGDRSHFEERVTRRGRYPQRRLPRNFPAVCSKKESRTQRLPMSQEALRALLQDYKQDEDSESEDESGSEESESDAVHPAVSPVAVCVE